MTPAAMALGIAERRLRRRLEMLEPRLDQEPGLWPEYAVVAQSLAAIARQTAPGAGGELLTTKEVAARFNVSAKTVRRRGLAGQLPEVEPIRLARRGPAALRWRQS